MGFYAILSPSGNHWVVNIPPLVWLPCYRLSNINTILNLKYLVYLIKHIFRSRNPRFIYIIPIWVKVSKSTKIVEGVPASDRGDFIGQKFTNKGAVGASAVEGAVVGGIATGNVKGGVTTGGLYAAGAAVIPDKGTLTRPGIVRLTI